MTTRPPLPDTDSNERAQRQEVRAMLLLESFGGNDQVLSDWLAATMGSDRAATLGPPDTSANTLLTVAQQLSTPGLYGLGAPFLRNRDEAAALPVIFAMQDGGVWERMQFVELMARGVGDWVLRVEVDEDGVVRVRNADPWNVWTRCAYDRYDRILELRERRCRVDPAGNVGWYWDTYVVEKGKEQYAIYEADGRTPVSNLFLTMPDGTPAPPEGLTGEAYPFRYRDGRAFLPFVFYATLDAGTVWHEMGRRGATRGALNSITYHTYVGKVAHSATGTAVIAVGLQPPAGNVSGAGMPDSSPSISLNPGEIVFLQPREGVNVASVTQVGPGANLDVLSRYAMVYEAQQAYREGLSSDDVSRDTANPESAAALSIKNSGKRAAAARITPHFRRRDQELVAKAAALLRLAGVSADAPESGWSIEYRQIPIGADEQQALLDYGISQRSAGLLSTVDLYLQLHPGVSREAAVAELQRIRRDEQLLSEDKQEPESEEAGDEDKQLGALIGDAERLLASDDVTGARASLLAAKALIGMDEAEDLTEAGDMAEAEPEDGGTDAS